MDLFVKWLETKLHKVHLFLHFKAVEDKHNAILCNNMDLY